MQGFEHTILYLIDKQLLIDNSSIEKRYHN